MAFYESIYILRPDLTTEQVEAINKRIADVVVSNKGQVLETELWGRRQLAYPVKKTGKGYYVFRILEGGGPLVANLESWMKINEDVLKCQHILVRAPRTTPSPLAPVGERRLDSETEEGAPAAPEDGAEKPTATREPTATRATRSHG